MRLSKTAWLILGVGIFVIAFGSLYAVYSQQSRAQEQLNDSISVAQATLAKDVSEKEDWDSQLAQLESQLSEREGKLADAELLLISAEASLPESVESIEYDEILFGIADSYNLEITSLTAAESSDQEVEDINFSVIPFAVNVRGEVIDILNFINTIATSEDFITATIEVVNMQVPVPLTEAEKEAIKESLTKEIMDALAEEDLTEEEREELLEELEEVLAVMEKEMEEEGKSSATISLVIYSYKGE